jgi:hypothetical protein
MVPIPQASGDRPGAARPRAASLTRLATAEELRPVADNEHSRLSSFAEKARSALSNAGQDDRVKQAAAVTRDVAARAEEASKTVTRRVGQEDAWDELRADVQLLTEIARAHHALIVDLLDRVAELEARAGGVHDS